ncbi:MAG TPA: DUF3486 family protein [Methanothrix sp.]|nr:DUF3486 family protein [Methanothrix sp.]HOL44525.1 DUF3486 family protein [Methanothrix sp.]
MPKRSKVTQLPPEVRQELDRKLIEGGFSDYTALSAWLAEQGYEISRSAIHRYGQTVEERIARLKAATDIAVTIAEEVGDDAGKITDAVVRMYQERIFNVLLEMGEISPDSVDITKLGRVIAEITRSSISQKKWMAEVREKAKKAVENIEQKAAKRMDPELLRIVKEEIYGIA